MDIADEITKALSEYTDEVKIGIEVASEETADEAINTLKANSPEGKRGKYSKGWRKKQTKNGYIIYNSTNAGLTHLLEKGHAKRNGGRTKAQAHIEPAEQNAIKNFEKKIERVIKKWT